MSGSKVCTLALLAAFIANEAPAQELRAPASAAAGQELAVSTAGSGSATFYLVGPGVAEKQTVALGEDIKISGHDLRNAGEYSAILCSDACRNTSFFVTPAEPSNLIFLVHPSRVPVALSSAISGVAFPFDSYRNLVTSAVSLDFQLSTKEGALWSRSERTQYGVAWFRTSSGKSAGAVQAAVSLDGLSTRRAVQQVASDPCNLRITGERTSKGIFVETEPVHDCAGNVVPDGTIVSFTATGPQGKGTVDAPVKQGVARAQMESSGPAVISVASGVVMGNEIRLGAQP
jgi:hypothetical protein